MSLAAPPSEVLERLLDERVATGEVSAAVAVTGSARRIAAWAAAGVTRARGGRPLRSDDRFDLASLTKPFAATLGVALDRSGRLPLATRVGELWGSGVAPRLADRSLGSLLRHRSGLRAWAPLYRKFRSREQAIAYLTRSEALSSRHERYSDLGFLLWGLSVERALGEDYGSLLDRLVLEPLKLESVGPPAVPSASTVECPLGNEREVELALGLGVRIARKGGPSVGEIQDGNARFLGGPHAHAGLFGSALDLFGLASEWLTPGRVLSRHAVTGALEGGRRFGLGWARRTLRGSGGPALSAAAFGHVGFTGGSVWIDPENDRIMVLLAHRVSASVNLTSWRRRFHRAALEIRTPKRERKRQTR